LNPCAARASYKAEQPARWLGQDARFHCPKLFLKKVLRILRWHYEFITEKHRLLLLLLFQYAHINNRECSSYSANGD
jgi:hypothetical protein